MKFFAKKKLAKYPVKYSVDCIGDFGLKSNRCTIAVSNKSSITKAYAKKLNKMIENEEYEELWKELYPDKEIHWARINQTEHTLKFYSVIQRSLDQEDEGIADWEK